MKIKSTNSIASATANNKVLEKLFCNKEYIPFYQKFEREEI
jgi:hypothetical protein